MCEGNDDDKYHSLIASKTDGNFMDCSGMYYACVYGYVCMHTCDVVLRMCNSKYRFIQEFVFTIREMLCSTL